MRLVQWNVTVQREITKNVVADASWIGNVGVWEDAGALSAFNALGQDTLRKYGFTDFTSASDATLLTTTIANLSAAQRATLASRGISLTPYAGFPASQTVRQALLPFPQYTATSATNTLLNPVAAPLGKSWYNGLQTTLTKRFSRGLVINANYTYSKTLNQTSTVDPYNRGLGKNLATTDLPHQFRLTSQYEVPRLRSNQGILSNKVVAYALSGWTTGWSLSYQSAALVGLPTSSGTVPISQFLGYGPGPAQLIPGANPWSVDWTDYSGTHHTDPLDINCHCFDPTKTQVLNPAAWTNVPNGQFAASQSSIRSFRGMRIPQESANFGRAFRIKERMNLNIRVEFSNIFNRIQYPAIALGNFAAAPTFFTSGPNKGLYSGGFGTINPTAGTAGSRTGSFVLRLQF